MSRLFVHHHIGLGDHFDCHGIIRHLSENPDAIMQDKTFETFHVFAIDGHYPIIEYMYRDNPAIVVENVGTYETEYEMVQLIIQRYNDPESAILKIGHEFYGGAGGRDIKENKNCWEYFYDQMQLPYNLRHELFYVLRDEAEEQRVFDKLNPTGEKFVFVHDSPERGYKIDRSHIVNKDLKVVENDLDENPLHFLKIIEDAEEIHCIESSFKTLIEYEEKLFFSKRQCVTS